MRPTTSTGRLRELRPGFDRDLIDAPFGVMFRDSLDGRVIADGLAVELCDVLKTSVKQLLSANGHGVFVAHRLPRMGPAGHDAGDSPPATRRFEVTVRDRLQRFLPMRFEADLPCSDLFVPDYLRTSPPEREPHLPLFSASTRDVPAGLGVVRAQLCLRSNLERAAAWARLELRLGTTLLAEGLADDRGCALLVCPLPAPRDPPLHGSPSAPTFDRTSWEVSLSVFWSATLAGEAVPELRALRQLHTNLLPARAFVLQAGVPLIARSPGSLFLVVDA